MSYMDDIRGALAATSGAARRSQALRQLQLGDDESTVQGWLDDASSALIEAIALLKKHGHSATGSDSIVASAKSTGWQSQVYGGKKEAGTTTRMPKTKRTEPRTYTEVFGEGEAAPAASTQEVDLAHPWRTEERS